MYKIALICEHGASTGICVRKMIEASSKLGIESDIASYSSAKLDFIIDKMDFILLGPQLSFKIGQFKDLFPQYSAKIKVINSADFGGMDGEKILKDTIARIESSRENAKKTIDEKGGDLIV